MQLRGEGRPAIAASSLRGGAAIAEVEAEWRRLLERAARPEPFLHPGWIRAHLEAFEVGADVRVVVARRGGRLVAVLPLVEEEARWKGFAYRRLRSASGVHSCRFDLLVEEGEEAEATRVVLDHLLALCGDVLELRDVPVGGAADRLMDHARAAGLGVGAWESMRTPYVILPTEGGIEAYLEELSSKFRANLRRRRKKLAANARVEFRRWTRAEPEVLESFYRLEAAGWKGRRGTAIAADPRTRAFYDGVAAWAAREGILSLAALVREGAPVAMHFGLAQGDVTYLPKPAYDERFAACSPGR